ncbi:MAG: hypothetical protein ABR514_07535, partial [Chthoniobacterales bacterium]
MDSVGNSCSILRMWKMFPALLVAATPLLAQEQPTAYDALRVLGHEMGRDSVNHVISLVGVDGAPQPENWKILLTDPGGGGMREVEVAEGRIVSERTPARPVIGSSEGATINTARLNLDSSGAYAVASHTADKSGTPFATANYTLRTDERGDPVWIVTLRNDSRRPIGTIHIGANRGNVTRTEGFFAGATMQDVATVPDVEPADQNARGIFQNAKSGISHGFYVAQHEARE